MHRHTYIHTHKHMSLVYGMSGVRIGESPEITPNTQPEHTHTHTHTHTQQHAQHEHTHTHTHTHTQTHTQPLLTWHPHPDAFYQTLRMACVYVRLTGRFL